MPATLKQQSLAILISKDAEDRSRLKLNSFFKVTLTVNCLKCVVIMYTEERKLKKCLQHANRDPCPLQEWFSRAGSVVGVT